MKKLAVLAAVSVILAACNSGMGESGGTAVTGGNDKPDRSRRTVIDSAKYTDFTVPENNAGKFTKQDVLYVLSGTYSMRGGNSFITIDRKEGTITLSSDNARHNNEGGHNMYAKYSFAVQAAGEDCLYIKMGDKKDAHLIIGAESYSGYEVPDLAVCLPLYGFSRNRVEVSPVMEGYILMPPGTYWAEKK